MYIQYHVDLLTTVLEPLTDTLEKQTVEASH